MLDKEAEANRITDEITVEEILTWPEMADIKAELDDPRFANRSHGSRATYALKCDGPLCRSRERIRARKRNERKAALEGRTYRPASHRLYDRDGVMESIIKWHKINLLVRRLEQQQKEAS